MVREVEDDESNNNSRNSCPEMTACKEKVIDAIEEVPNTTPDEDEADDGRKILGEVAHGDRMHRDDRYEK